ncbi:MAG: D-2-hydroxyacid dehydrogenase, partial [Gammaproteobacteria bacterium]|nr:D-2-hydroxyacid dehydrogenase [Gammaproteobacteria bacterium]
ADRLRWIHWSGAGVDAVLFPDLAASDIVLTNARGIFDRAMAEYVLGVILAFAKDLPRTLELQREHAWEHRLTECIAGRRARVVGVGSIGREIGRVLGAVGMHVEGIGRTARAGDADFSAIHAVADLDRRLGAADYVVLVPPLTEQTRGMMGAAQLRAMRPHARLINVGRGALLDEQALARALERGAIAGAALDVFATEPLPADSPLWDVPGLLVSPHMSGDFHGYPEALAGLFLDNLRRFRAGERLRNVVDKALGFVIS